MPVSDCLSFARALGAAGRAPGEIREAVRSRFGDLAADALVFESTADVAEAVGDTLAATVGETADDVVDLVGDAVGGLLDW